MNERRQMTVLVACEESQNVCKAFREKGHLAFSCDIKECSGGNPQWHIQEDVVPLLNGNCRFKTCDGIYHLVTGKWDLIIAFPPCTFLTVTGNRWYDVDKYGVKAIDRYKSRIEAVAFFMTLYAADCDKVAIENPVGVMSTLFRVPDQIISPYLFGDPFEKKTCLWLKGLPKLIPTNIVEPPPRIHYDSGKSMPAWYAELWRLPNDERARIRSTTFPGVSSAMADQWG